MKPKYVVFFSLMSFAFFSSMLLEENLSFSNSQGTIDLDNLFNYANQVIPEKAVFNFNRDNPITDETATLGRVLFYDKKLSLNNTVSCSSCHQQANAFGDSSVVSTGFDGRLTARHAMRLVNVGFSFDHKRFWDKRSSTLETTVTAPFQNEIEMGFSGMNGQPPFDSLLSKMREMDYYSPLFVKAFGDDEITERRMQTALAHFIRSIRSFDSRFDEGYEQVTSEVESFPNFTDIENEGKRLFFNAPLTLTGAPERSGAFCGVCHKVPAFGILHFSQNNGVIGVVGDPSAVDLSIERSPSLRDLVNMDGSSNGPFMHDGSLATLEDVVNHYDSIPFDPDNTNFSGLFFPKPDGSVDLELSDESKGALVAFLKTFSGREIYTNEKWSDPFDENGKINVFSVENCPSDTFQFNATICSGEEFIIPNGSEVLTFDSTGQYSWAIARNDNCDSVVILNLLELPLNEQVIDTSICTGESYLGFSDSGVYSDILVDVNGCDSITTIELQVLNSDDPLCIISSASEELEQPYLSVFPNPFEHDIKLTNSSGGSYLYSIFTLQGNLLSKGRIKVAHESTLNLDYFEAGVYLFQLKNTETQKISTFKIVKINS